MPGWLPGRAPLGLAAYKDDVAFASAVVSCCSNFSTASVWPVIEAESCVGGVVIWTVILVSVHYSFCRGLWPIFV